MSPPAEHRSPLDRLIGPLREAILASIDPNEVVARVDPNGVVRRIDVNELLDRVEVNDLLDRVDVDRLLDRVDVERLLDRVDVDALMARVDVDALVQRIDVDALVDRVDVDSIVASSTGRVAGNLVDVVRRQLVGLDTIVLRTVQRARGTDPETVPDGPPALMRDDGTHAGRGGYDVTGRYAGPLTRLAANAGDVAAGFGLFTLLSAGTAYLGSILFGIEFNPGQSSGPLWWASLVAVLFLYGWLSVAIAGRTPAMGVLGLRVVARDGRPLSTGRAALRVLMLPVSALAFGAGFLGLLFNKERRGLHDAVAGSVVVYDWGDRPASMPTPLGDWLSRHDEGGDLPPG